MIVCLAARGGDGGTVPTLVFLQQRASLQYRAGDSPRQDEAWRLHSVRHGVYGVVEMRASSVIGNTQTRPAGRVRAREGAACPFLDCVEEERERERERGGTREREREVVSLPFVCVEEEEREGERRGTSPKERKGERRGPCRQTFARLGPRG